MDCSVCMSAAVFPVELRCKHIFCYLCVKGLINGSQNCALCRQAIPKNLLFRPKFVRNSIHSDRPDFDGPQWFYEGKPGLGFWAYDYFNGRLLEESYSSDKKMFDIMISGVEYCVDFVQQIQYRKDCPQRKRRITRDLLSNIGIFKGIAGVPKHLVPDMVGGTNSNPNQSVISGQQMPSNSNNTVVNDNEDNCGAQTPSPKRIKVEVKEEPIEEPDSTAD